MRVLFLTQFFKIVSNDPYSLKNEFTANPFLINQLIDFSNYVKQLAIQLPEEHIDVELYAFSTFVLQQSYRHMLSSSEEVDAVLNERDQFFIEQIKKLFTSRAEASQQKTLYKMHLHRLYNYLVKQEKRRLRQNEIIDVFATYFAVKTFQTAPDIQNDILISEITPFVQSLLPLGDFIHKLDRESASCEELPSPSYGQDPFGYWDAAILKELMAQITNGIGFSKIASNGEISEISCSDQGVLTCVWENRERLELVLSSASVYYNRQKTSCGAKFSVNEYEELFGEKLYPTYSFGEVLLLEHPEGVFEVEHPEGVFESARTLTTKQHSAHSQNFSL